MTLIFERGILNVIARQRKKTGVASTLSTSTTIQCPLRRRKRQRVESFQKRVWSPPTNYTIRVSPTRKFTDEEEREINELFEGLHNITIPGITSLDRVLWSELKDTEKLLSHALEKSGGTVASLNEYVSVVENSTEDINVWSTVFETKLVNIRKNIDVIKRRDDVIKLLGDNERTLTGELLDALQKLEALTENRDYRGDLGT